MQKMKVVFISELLPQQSWPGAKANDEKHQGLHRFIKNF